MPARSCSITGCERPAKSRGWCGTHYEQQRRGGLFVPADTHRLGQGSTLAERIWSKVERRDGHWIWIGTTNGRGYGSMTVDGRKVLAHRVVYELLVSPIPDGLHLDHLCRVTLCVNPAHLEPVTCRQNLMRGQGPTALNAVKTHCPEGHPYDDENTVVWQGRRGCHVCKLSRRRAAHEAARQARSA